jgi:hypothetical protein
MNEQDKKFLEENPDAEFVGMIKVGAKGVRTYYTDRAKYYAKRDKAWDSGLDLECKIIKGIM